MKRIYYLSAIVLPLLLAAACNHAPAGREGAAPLQADSTHTVHYVNDICMTEPGRALAILDEMERDATVPQCRIDRTRSVVYNNGFHKYQLAQYYGLKVADNTEYKELYPEDYVRNFNEIADRYIRTGQYEQALRTVDRGLEAAASCAVPAHVAALRNLRGEAWYRLGNRDKGMAEIGEAIRELEKLARGADTYLVADDWLLSTGRVIEMLTQGGDAAKAVTLFPRMLAALDAVEHGPDITDGVIEYRRVAVYGQMLQTALAPGSGVSEHDIDGYFNQLRQTSIFDTPTGQAMAFSYYMHRRDYPAARRAITSAMVHYRQNADTVCEHYRQLLEWRVQLAEATGETAAGFTTARALVALTDTLRHRELDSNAREYMEVSERRQQEAEVSQARTSLHFTRIALVLAGAVIVLLVVFFVRSRHYIRRLKRKDEALTRNINELVEAHRSMFDPEEDLERGGALAPRSGESVPVSREGTTSLQSDRDLFEKVNRVIIKERLFLEPEINRTELMSRFGVPGYRFASLFQDHAGKSYKQYIHDLRLEYALQLLIDNPEYTIEHIALECGYQNRTTFYRRFVEKYGLTPTQLRDRQNSL